MNRLHQVLFGLALVLAASATMAGSARVIWDNRPVAITLAPDIESRITFPAEIGEIEIGVPPALATRLNVQHIDNNVWLRATEAFTRTRVHVRAKNGSAYYLIDLASEKDAPAPTEIEFFDPIVRKNDAGDAAAIQKGDASGQGVAPEVALTRFMASQFYGPARLSATLPGASRISTRMPQRIPLVFGEALTAQPIAAWSYAGLYGLAVRLVNGEARDQVVDPRHFRGEWATATPQHALLLSASSEAATRSAANETVVYLVSRHPLEDLARDLPNSAEMEGNR